MRNFIIMLVLLLGACGGGAPSSSPAPVKSATSLVINSSVAVSSAINSSSANSSSSNTDPYLAVLNALPVREVTYRVQEDQALKIDGEISLVNQQWMRFDDFAWRTSGEGVAIVHYHDKQLTYTPAEDFNGKDEFFYLDYLPSGGVQRVKVMVDVLPAEDGRAKWKLAASQVLVSGATHELPLPVYPDTGAAIQIDNSAQLVLDGENISYRLVDGKVVVNVPEFERAGIYELSLNHGNFSFNLQIPVVIVDGEVTYYMGNRDSMGSVISLVRTASVSDQQYLQWIGIAVVPLLKDELLQTYKKYWTFAVIQPKAEQSIAVSRNSDGSARPVGNYAQYYQDFANQYLPGSTEVVVLDGQSFRANSGFVISVNIFNMAGTLFHELGHAHAKLGDEYAETCTYAYTNNANPNIAKGFVGDINILQWKHWIVDAVRVPGSSIDPHKVTDIGAFLGAFYCDDRYYRPALSTLMRNQVNPPSSVDKEAWGLANYENVDFLGSLESEQKTGSNRLAIKRVWDPSVTSSRWFLDDVEIPEFAGRTEAIIDESVIAKNTYSVRVELQDLTGFIVDPYAYWAFNDWNNLVGTNSRFKRTWIFNKVDANRQKIHIGKPAPIANQSWVEHTLEIGPRGHQLNHTRYYGATEIIHPVTGASDFAAEIIVDGAMAFTLGIETKQYDTTELLVPSLAHNAYRLVHPAISGSYQIKIYSLPSRELVATIDTYGR